MQQTNKARSFNKAIFPIPVKHHSTQKQPAYPEQFHKALLGWYSVHGRHHLPWRNTDDAYHILVSEIMLQQTQVDTVLNRYYQPFLKQFPSLAALKDAPLESVMHAWQGLGYYRRVGYLHAIAHQTAPALPQNFEALTALPGIGKNTAHALLAFAYRKPYAVMEANVKRIISRIFARISPSENELWDYAGQLLNQAEPFDHNQAMMDLGAMICTPVQPKCNICPANDICQGQSDPLLYPAKKQKLKTRIRKRQIIVVSDGKGNIYAKPREGNLLGGLYQFIELESDETHLQLNGSAYPKSNWRKLGNIRQIYSHFTLEAEVFEIQYNGTHAEKHWYAPKHLPELPWSNAEKKILALLDF